MTSVELNELFENHSIPKLKDIKEDIDKRLNHERDTLKAAVGARYKDFLDVADKIADMKQLAQAQNVKLSQLSFGKASYSKCDGLAKFNSLMRKDRATEAKLTNKPVILKHMISNLSRKVATLNSSSEATGVECLALAKTCHCLSVLLSDQHASHTDRFEKVKSSFSSIINRQIKTLSDEDEDEKVLNLASALCALNNSNTLEALTVFLQVRLEHIKGMSLETEFQQCLLYTFSSTGWFTVLINKLPLFLSRHLDQKGWTGLPIITEWRDWFDEFQLESNWAQSVSSECMEEVITTWKARLAGFLYTEFQNILFKPTGATRAILHQVLLSFKTFTSLADLSYDGISLVEWFLQLWSSEFEKQALAELGQLSHVTHDILAICSTSPSYDKAPRLFQEGHSLVNYKVYLENIRLSISNKVGPSSQLVGKVDSLHANSESYAETLASFKDLSASLNRQTLSVDDCENPEFWAHMEERLREVQHAISERCATLIKTSEKEFLEKGQAVAFSELASTSKTGVLCFLRVLSSWKQKPPLCKMFIAEEDALFQQMEDLFVEALSGFCRARAEKSIPELVASVESASDDIIVSSETQLVVYRLCLDLLNDEAGNNYGEIYLGESFQKVKPNLVSSLFSQCQGETLSAFADRMFIALFSTEGSQKKQIDLVKSSMREKDIDETKIEKCYKEAVDQYKKSSLVFSPLSIV